MSTTKTKKMPRSLGDVFTSKYKGPFMAILDNGDKMPSLHQKDADGHWAWSEDCNHEGGSVVDSSGVIVCKAATYVAAMTIASNLNKVVCLDGPAAMLGVGRNFRLCRDNKFTFWTIVIDWTTKNAEGAVRSTERYLMPFWQGIWCEPMWSNWAIDALRFNSETSAKYALDYIQNVIMELQDIKDLCEQHPDWPMCSIDKARVVKVYWMTRDALPDEGFTYIDDKDGNTIKCSISDFGIVTPVAMVTKDGLVDLPKDYKLSFK